MNIELKNKIIRLMKKHGCIEDFGTGIDFDSIGEVVGEIKGKDISKISETTIYLEDGTELPIDKLTDKQGNKIIEIINNF